MRFQCFFEQAKIQKISETGKCSEAGGCVAALKNCNFLPGFSVSGYYGYEEIIDGGDEVVKVVFHYIENYVAIDVEVTMCYVIPHSYNVGPRNFRVHFCQQF